MNLEELREARRTERNRDGLQSLPDSFYRDVAAYVADLKAERERAAEAADDPFSAPEVRRLTDEIETAEELVQSLYERRVGKVVDRASFAAADKRHETGGLTAEEEELFDDLVARIERNRERVIDALDTSAADASGTSGSDPPATGDATAAPEDPPPRSGPEDEADDAGATDAPDPTDLLTEAMGGAPSPSSGADAGTADGQADPAEPTEATDGGTSPDETGAGVPASDASPVPAAATTPGGSDGTGATADGAGDAGETGGDEAATTARTTVYVTRDVGEIFGVDERTYRLAAEDVVDLPADNARALVERDAAEPLE
ncbi:MAG: hypothetical protein ABEJ81_00660 [Haloferacaceae archaeon]